MRAVRLLVFATGLLISGCSRETVVPPVAVNTPPDMRPIPGNYAATVVAGQWNLESKSDRFTCSAWTIDADIDHSYQQTMQSALTQALERVTFVPEPLTADELGAQGYDAQIVIGQREADATFAVTSTLLRGSIRSDVALAAIVAVQGADASVHQQRFSARGRGDSDTSYCSYIGPAITAAAQDAVGSIAQQVVLYVREDINGRRLARADAAATARIQSETVPQVAQTPESQPATGPGARAESEPTYVLPRELMEPRPPAARRAPSKQSELQRDLAEERARGEAAAGAIEEGPMKGATESPATAEGKPAAGAQDAATSLSPAPSSLTKPEAQEGVTVAAIPPGASVNAGESMQGVKPDIEAAQAFTRAVGAAAGRGVEQNDAEALKWFRVAADRGYAPAENDLGFMYAEGRGVTRDDAEAARWYKRAADRGYAPAQTSLGMLYAQGRGVPQSDFEALALYSAAANQGFPQAKANLAEMYASGRGVPRDERTASFLAGSVRVKPLAGSGVYVETPEPQRVAPAAAPGQ